MNTNLHDQNGNEVDQVLGQFFMAEMPDPWPACRALRQPPLQNRRSLRALLMPRLALAASLLLFFFGYFLLAGMFPKSSQSNLQGGSQEIGSRPKLEHKIQPSKTR